MRIKDLIPKTFRKDYLPKDKVFILYSSIYIGREYNNLTLGYYTKFHRAKQDLRRIKKLIKFGLDIPDPNLKIKLLTGNLKIKKINFNNIPPGIKLNKLLLSI